MILPAAQPQAFFSFRIPVYRPGLLAGLVLCSSLPQRGERIAKSGT